MALVITANIEVPPSTASLSDQSALTWNSLNWFSRWRTKPVITPAPVRLPEHRPIITPTTIRQIPAISHPPRSTPIPMLTPKPIQGTPNINQSSPRSRPSQQPEKISDSNSFPAIEREITTLFESKSLLGPDHYQRLHSQLDKHATAGINPTLIAQLRQKLDTLNPDKIKSLGTTASPAPETFAPPLKKLPVLKNLGVNFEQAFVFLPSENKLFLEYGAEVSGPSGPKILPTFEYRTAPDAEVFAAMDGVVTNVTYQDRNQDYSIHLQPETNSPWILEHDHVSNPRVSKGDQVKAGDILGKVGKLDSNLGRTEIMLWDSSGSRPMTYCPLLYFDLSLLSPYKQKIQQHMRDWEAFKGNSNLYNEEKHLLPGCAYENLAD